MEKDMRKIDPFRMIGRFQEAAEFLMGKYNLEFNGEAPDWSAYFLLLSERVKGSDKEFCKKMATDSKEYEDLMKDSKLSQFEADHETESGRKEAQYIFSNYADDYADKILGDEDFLKEIENEEDKKERKTRKFWNVFLLLAGLIVLGIIIYHLPYFKEQRQFAQLEKVYKEGSHEFILDEISNYRENYPQGRHSDEVDYMYVECMKRSRFPASLLEAAEKYLKSNPDGAHVKECNAIVDSLWNQEIEFYKTKTAYEKNKKGLEFMISMLEYMKKNHIRTIKLTGQPQLKLKDFNDYPADKRKAMEKVGSVLNFKGLNGQKFKFPEDLVSIKKEINEERAKEWMEDIKIEFQKIFNDLLSPDFIMVETIPESDLKANGKYPLITIDYDVETLESGGFPKICTYETGSGFNRGQEGIYFCIQMTFNTIFSLPGEKAKYNFSSTEDMGVLPQREINANAYTTMADICIQKYMMKLWEEFGFLGECCDPVN